MCVCVCIWGKMVLHLVNSIFFSCFFLLSVCIFFCSHIFNICCLKWFVCVFLLWKEGFLLYKVSVESRFSFFMKVVLFSFGILWEKSIFLEKKIFIVGQKVRNCVLRNYKIYQKIKWQWHQDLIWQFLLYITFLHIHC